MAMTRLLLFFVVVIAEHYGATPPNVRPPAEQLREQRGLERGLPFFTASGRILLWSWAFLEGSVLLALSGYCPPGLARPLLHALPTTVTSDPTSHTALTPAFLAGTLLTLAGALLRAHCFHTLGAHFTFELSIHPTHALVTHGAYGVVRHPSYTALVGLVVGWLLCALDRRGWVVSAACARLLSGGHGRRKRAMATGVWACMWAAVLGTLYVVMSKRMDKEDAMLERSFGEAWQAWAERVPCRLIPGVY
ncbi:hypothetical protein HD554DRAFT_2141346 [Boletus coccyginus]|nr:hypothetical protein HD554DRAFT_2141346 [Boletus coccyginus]